MKQPTIEALLYVFENAQHFGPSLFHPCYHLIISFISQETNQINMIHETGLSQSILNCLMANDVSLIGKETSIFLPIVTFYSSWFPVKLFKAFQILSLLYP